MFEHLKHVVLAVTAALLVSACAGAPGDAEIVTGAIPAGQARVKVTRTNALMYSGAPATITVNGKKMTDVWTGATSSFHVPAGQNVIAASAWSYPGEYKVNLNAVAGQTYELVVEPRGDSVIPGSVLGPIGGMIDAAANENAGAFQLRMASAGGATQNAATSANAAQQKPPLKSER